MDILSDGGFLLPSIKTKRLNNNDNNNKKKKEKGEEVVEVDAA